MKITVNKFNQIKQDIKQANTKTKLKLIDKYRISDTTLRNISQADNYVDYRIRLRRLSQDWLLDRGYEDVSVVKKYISKLRRT